MPADEFYTQTLNSLLESGWLSTDDRVLVACGGPIDSEAVLAVGLTDVVISNLDERMIDDGRYAPLEWSFQDVEALGYDDESFDVCIVHDGLHHCRSPHTGLLEMLRVARRGVLAFEPRDSGIMRLGVRLNFGQEYETAAVAFNDLTFGGVRNSHIPNYVHRWTEREVEKTARAALAEGEPEFRYFHALRIPEQRFKGMQSRVQRWGIQLARPVLRGVSRVLPRQTNGFAFAITKPTRPNGLHPWLKEVDGRVQPAAEWFAAEYILEP